MQCKRCHKFKDFKCFIRDRNVEVICRECLTDDELHDYITSPITKAMKGLSVKEKQRVIKALVDDYKQQREEAYA